MLRNLNKSSGGRRVLGVPSVGILASQIIAETASGDQGPGLLYNEAQANPGKQLRIRITSSPSSGALFVWENGAFELTGAADGTYSIGYQYYLDNVLAGSDTASVTIGSANASVPAGAGVGAGSGSGGIPSAPVSANVPPAVGIGAGSGAGGAAVGQNGQNAVVPPVSGVSNGSGQGGIPVGDGNAVVQSSEGISAGAGAGGQPDNGNYTAAPAGPGPAINRVTTRRPANVGGRRI